MKQFIIFILTLILFSSTLYGQKDTVYVPGYYESNLLYGTLNDAIEAAVAAGTINNTVFKLTPYEQYVLSRSIYMDHGQNLEIVAPKAGNDQESAPPQIVWTEEGIDRVYIIQSYGDVIMKNVWVRHADVLGNSLACSIVFENQDAANDPEIGNFDGCLFDYCGDGAEAGGAITIKADHFEGEFQNCYFRNLSDIHFQYYGRAISFPYQSSGWHYDKLLFENCSFSNISRIIMQEGNEFGSNIHINHCTVVNAIEWIWQSAGWLETASITNSVFINPYMMGYRALDVCDMGPTGTQDYDDFLDGNCDSPGGGLINGITPVDSFGFEVDFTDFDRKLFIGNNAYLYKDWMLDWYANCPWAKDKIRNRLSDEIRHPSPMLGQNEIDFIDSVDENGNKVFPNLNVDWETIYTDDPGFMVEPTNLDTLKLFIEAKWNNNADFEWSYQPNAGLNQVWPLPENMAYTNTAYQTAAMGGFPLGDLNWFPDQKAAWEAQRDAEWETIYGLLNRTTGVEKISGLVPSDYVLEQNYPNPFNPATKIDYSIPEAGNVSLKVYNTLGQEIATIFTGYQQAGKYAATFNASGLASGVYIYRLEVGDISISKNFVLMK
ncbi:MAG: T9SS type A sorting domain-containing protein [Melioribacteraceae bacterium]|nr:T9SS type A sorting domain-containing protein [Melioribacteraceae bacterium]